MSLQSLFTGESFARTIQTYAAQNSWKVYDLTNERAVLRFSMDSGRVQSLWVVRFDSTLEFSVPSIAMFHSESEIPDTISTLLLQRNSERKIGFWCIEKIGGRFVYSCMHNAETQLLNATFFAQIVKALISECDNFETIWLRSIR